jgi:hypothetical protein
MLMQLYVKVPFSNDSAATTTPFTAFGQSAAQYLDCVDTDAWVFETRGGDERFDFSL